MEATIPLLFAAVVGFTHAFEVDHLLAVSNIVTRRRTLLASLKDGVYWGLGHTSTILLVGLLVIVIRVSIAERTFSYFEAAVGLMLIVLGAYRLWKARRIEPTVHDHHHEEPHHHLAYGVGLVHGLAGSGALVLLVMTQLKSSFDGIVYLLIFGFGSVVGMLLASGVFSLPLSQKISRGNEVRWAFTLLSSLLCMVFGAKVVWENLMGG
ncbi:MAG: urease accessory protein [Saprospiraceae bacterium]|nr:urease accessory protein [Saprospiraceae bacterium]